MSTQAYHDLLARESSLRLERLRVDYEVALERLARLGWAGPATWISIETARDEQVAVAGFAADAERVHGRARLTLLRATQP